MTRHRVDLVVNGMHCASCARAVERALKGVDGVPSASVGNMVHAVKSIPIPITSAGSTPLSRSTAGMAVLKTSI